MKARIIAKDMSIIFPLFDNVNRSMKSSVFTLGKASEHKRTFTGLDCVNLEINSGEAIGLLGNNGAGKSTLLRTLAGVYAPSRGELSVSGTLASLFEVSVGMDMDISGYDNIPLLMAVRGIPVNAYQHIVEDVENFTELGEALHRPLRTYSNGMRLRIAFAIATAVKTDILLMDEVIGVGDQSFRHKAKLRIETLMESAGILVLASHSELYLRAYCQRGIVFNKGCIVFDGPITDAIEFHNEKKP